MCTLVPARLRTCDATALPDIARFRVGTGNPREKDARRKEKKTEREGE